MANLDGLQLVSNCRLAIKILYIIRGLVGSYTGGELHFSSTGSWTSTIFVIICDAITGSPLTSKTKKNAKKCVTSIPQHK